MRYGVTGFAGFVWVYLLVSNPASAQEEVRLTAELVPLATALEELTEAIEADPADPKPLRVLGLVHCFAYAYDRAYFPEFDPAPGPFNMALDPVPRHTASTLLPVSRERLNHLAEAILVLRECVERMPEDSRAPLALGYAYEQAAKRCVPGEWLHKQVPFDEEAAETMGESAYWEEEALAQYRKALALDEAAGERPSAFMSDPIREGIVRILEKRGALDEAEQEELAGLANSREPSMLVIPPAVLSELEALYPVVPARVNAAEYYLHAADASFDHIEIFNADLPFIGHTPLAFPPEPLSEMARYYLEKNALYNQECLRLLNEAVNFPQSRYPIDLSGGFTVDLPHLIRLRGLANLAASATVYAADAGDADRAVQLVVATLSIGQSLAREPLIISQMTRWSCEGKALDALEQVASRVVLSEGELGRLQAAVAKSAGTGSFIAALTGDRYVAQSVLVPLSDDELIDMEENGRGGVGIGLGLVQDPEGGPSAAPVDEDRDARIRRLRAEYGRAEAFLREMRDTRVGALDTYLEGAKAGLASLQKLVELPADFDPNNPAATPRNIAPGASPIYRLVVGFIRHATRLRVVETALAAQRYQRASGEWPASVEALVSGYVDAQTIIDPYTEDFLQMDVADDRIVVYSVADAMVNFNAKQDGVDAPSGISFTVMF